SGTPTTAGAYSFTIKATDANNVAATKPYSGTIVPLLSISTTSLPAPVVGQAYSQTVTTSGGTPAITFAVSAGALPAGLALTSSTGIISGNPTTAGAYNFTIKATDANSFTATQTYSGTVSTVPVANNSSATVAYNSSNDSITLSITGTYTSVAVSTQAT